MTISVFHYRFAFFSAEYSSLCLVDYLLVVITFLGELAVTVSHHSGVDGIQV